MTPKVQREDLIELAHLAQIYLLQEYDVSDWIYAESASYGYFKKFAMAQKKQPVQAIPEPTKVQTQPLPSIPPALPKPSAPVPQMQAPSIAPQLQKPIAATVETVKPPKEAIKEPLPEKSKLFKLEPMEPPKPIDFSDWRTIMSEKFPAFKILDTIPDDSQAKVKVDRSKIIKAAVISLKTLPLHQSFCDNIAAAIDICLVPAMVIGAAKYEKELQWDKFLSLPSLKLIIISYQDLQNLPNLFKHYSKDSSQEFLGKIPVLVLQDIEGYFKDFARKKVLWETLEAHLTRKN